MAHRDVVHPTWRASAIGVYRLWRDAGYALGAILAGVVADAWGLGAALGVVAALTLASGAIVAVRMRETMKPHAAPVIRPYAVAGTPVAPME